MQVSHVTTIKERAKKVLFIRISFCPSSTIIFESWRVGLMTQVPPTTHLTLSPTSKRTSFYDFSTRLQLTVPFPTFSSRFHSLNAPSAHSTFIGALSDVIFSILYYSNLNNCLPRLLLLILLRCVFNPSVYKKNSPSRDKVASSPLLQMIFRPKVIMSSDFLPSFFHFLFLYIFIWVFFSPIASYFSPVTNFSRFYST